MADALAGRDRPRALSEKALAMVDGHVCGADVDGAARWRAFWPEVMSGRTPSMLNGVAVERSIERRAESRPSRTREGQLSPVVRQELIRK